MLIVNKIVTISNVINNLFKENNFNNGFRKIIFAIKQKNEA